MPRMPPRKRLQAALFCVRIKAERAHKTLPGLAIEHRRGNGGNAASNLGDLDDGEVLAIRRGTMTGIATDAHATLAGTLLADVDDNGIRAITHWQVRTAGFRQAVLPGKSLRLVFGNPLGTQTAAGFLVGKRHKRQGAGGLTAPGDLAGNCRHGGGDKQHVHRAAAVDKTVDDLCAERVGGPFRLVDGHDIDVAEQGERLGSGIGTFHRHRQGRPVRVWFEFLGGNAGGVGEELLQGGDVAFLGAGIGGEIIDAAVADQFLQQGESVVVQAHRGQGSGCGLFQVFAWYAEFLQLLSVPPGLGFRLGADVGELFFLAGNPAHAA